MKNSVQIIGNVGSTPAIYELQGGNLVARFTVATHENIRNADGKKESTTWHNVVAWGNNAKYIEKNLNKGASVALEGKLVNRKWEGKDGKKHEITEIKVNEILITHSPEPRIKKPGRSVKSTVKTLNPEIILN
jgi:single-strand DNA-binding protein